MNKIPQPKIALVAGASGIIGRELVKTLLRNRWEVIGLSRHASSHPENIPFIHVDLLDAQHSAQKLHSLNGVTHIFYSAWANAGIAFTRRGFERTKMRAVHFVSLHQAYRP